MITAVDPLAPVVMTYGDKVSQNAEIAIKSGSTWVVAVFGLLGGIYASLSAAQQAQLVEQFPFLHGWTPIVTLVVAFLVAKLKPSNAVSASTQSLIDEVARLRLNSFLRARGSTELPPPAAAPLPAVPSVVPVPAIVTPQAPPETLVAAPAPSPIPPGAIFTPSVKADIPAQAVVTVSPPLPIDPRLLLSLVHEYLTAQVPPKAPASADAASHL